ncbi:MAG: 5-formyltetrahydrofolate cyclo-ligase [Neisseriaceae bacterium]
MTKEELRIRLISQCKTIDDDYRKVASDSLLNNVLPLIKDKQNILIYRAYGFEIDLHQIINYSVKNNKNLFQPFAIKDDKFMCFVPYNESKTEIFTTNEECKKYGLTNWQELDLILLPVVGMDKNGYRLGKGGGYYDTTLAQINSDTLKRPILCGVGYNCQVIDTIFPDSWDIKLDYFVSESELIKF